jgi:predicted CoA-substrate-specific enzyme activase
LYTMGIDIGSTSSKAVIMEDGSRIVASCVVPVGTGTSGPQRVIEDAMQAADLDKEDIEYIIATGYGRRSIPGANEQISEITCHARGVHFLLPSTRTIIDIGGQDVKVIRVDENGSVMNFVMNEKCAAGTGRFLEVMARVLECKVSELSILSSQAKQAVPISSTCTVFAESEVISQLAGGNSREDVVAGIHDSVARRVASLGKRVGLIPDIVMTGGVALNGGVVKAMMQELKTEIKTSPLPQLTGAVGAALLAYQKAKKTQANV